MVFRCLGISGSQGHTALAPIAVVEGIAMRVAVPLRYAIPDNVRQHRFARFSVGMFVLESVACFIVSVLVGVTVLFDVGILIGLHRRTMNPGHKFGIPSFLLGGSRDAACAGDNTRRETDEVLIRLLGCAQVDPNMSSLIKLCTKPLRNPVIVAFAKLHDMSSVCLPMRALVSRHAI